MMYSDCASYGFLPKKGKYTIRDARNAVSRSLLKPYAMRTLHMREAVFLVKCSAIFHDAEYSAAIADYDEQKEILANFVS